MAKTYLPKTRNCVVCITLNLVFLCGKYIIWDDVQIAITWYMKYSGYSNHTEYKLLIVRNAANLKSTRYRWYITNPSIDTFCLVPDEANSLAGVSWIMTFSKEASLFNDEGFINDDRHTYPLHQHLSYLCDDWKLQYSIQSRTVIWEKIWMPLHPKNRPRLTIDYITIQVHYEVTAL